jgi:hypothetical protein
MQQGQQTEIDVGWGLRLRIPQHWKVRQTATETLLHDPQTQYVTRIFAKPSPLHKVSLEHLTTLGIRHVEQSMSNGRRAGIPENITGAGWEGCQQMLIRDKDGQEYSRILYTALIVPDPQDKQRQQNVSIVQSIPKAVFEQSPPHHRHFLSSALRLQPPVSPAVSGFGGASGLSLALVSIVPPDSATTAKASPEPAPCPIPQHAPLAASATPGSSSRRRQPIAVPETPETELDLSLAAHGQRLIIYAIVINFVFRVVNQTLHPSMLVMLIMGVLVTGFTLKGIVEICFGLGKSHNQRLLWMVGGVVPLLNILVLVGLSVKTTRQLRASGWEVGLMGAK